MTSKEAITRIKRSHFTAMACLDGLEDKETEQAINIIEKDLETLELLRKRLHVLWKFKDSKGAVIGESIGFTLASNTDTDFKKIEEWLENNQKSSL